MVVAWFWCPRRLCVRVCLFACLLAWTCACQCVRSLKCVGVPQTMRSLILTFNVCSWVTFSHAVFSYRSWSINFFSLSCSFYLKEIDKLNRHKYCDLLCCRTVVVGTDWRKVFFVWKIECKWVLASIMHCTINAMFLLVTSPYFRSRGCGKWCTNHLLIGELLLVSSAGKKCVRQ